MGLTLSVMKYTEVILRNPEVDTEYRSSKGILLGENVQNGEDMPFNS